MRVIHRFLWMGLGLCSCSGQPPADTQGSPTSEASDADADTDADSDADGDVDTDADGDTNGTSLAVTFAIDPDVAESMDDPPVGMFYGQVFRADDVGPLGPSNDAEELGTITADLDLPLDGSATGILFELTPVPAVEIAILGFVDINGNADPEDPDLGPDRGEPVTLPGDNKFDLQAEQQNVVEVFFGLLNPL
jgi:hypothetical protein